MANQIYAEFDENNKPVLRCDCGAIAHKKDWNRFVTRHPKLCNTRKAFAKQLAQGNAASRRLGKE